MAGSCNWLTVYGGGSGGGLLGPISALQVGQRRSYVHGGGLGGGLLGLVTALHEVSRLLNFCGGG